LPTLQDVVPTEKAHMGTPPTEADQLVLAAEPGLVSLLPRCSAPTITSGPTGRLQTV
jgi:hypothetical protein